MKKTLFIFLALAMIFSLASICHASGSAYQLIGRELSPGILSGDTYYGALFLGKIFDETGPVGYFSVVLNRVDEGVEECVEEGEEGGITPITKFKLVMNFDSNSRLVLVMKNDQAAAAYWDYDDPTCPYKCVFPGYGHYLGYLSDGPSKNCGTIGDPTESLIARVGAEVETEGGVEVGGIKFKKQWLGSWGNVARGVTGAEISGWLVHTPLLIPAVFGTVELKY